MLNKLTPCLVALTLSLPVVAAADSTPGPVRDMECLVGTWHGTGSIEMGGHKATMQASWTCRRVSAQWGVLCTLHATGIPGLPSYEETDLMGYEPNSRTYHWYAVTNAGETHDHVARIPAGDTFHFVYRGAEKGKPMREVIAMRFGKGSTRVTGRSETTVAGRKASVMTFDMHKQVQP